MGCSCKATLFPTPETRLAMLRIRLQLADDDEVPNPSPHECTGTNPGSSFDHILQCQEIITKTRRRGKYRVREVSIDLDEQKVREICARRLARAKARLYRKSEVKSQTSVGAGAGSGSGSGSGSGLQMSAASLTQVQLHDDDARRVAEFKQVLAAQNSEGKNQSSEVKSDIAGPSSREADENWDNENDNEDEHETNENDDDENEDATPNYASSIGAGSGSGSAGPSRKRKCEAQDNDDADEVDDNEESDDENGAKPKKAKRSAKKPRRSQ
jgi:hypothetical protein